MKSNRYLYICVLLFAGGIFGTLHAQTKLQKNPNAEKVPQKTAITVKPAVKQPPARLQNAQLPQNKNELKQQAAAQGKALSGEDGRQSTHERMVMDRFRKSTAPAER